MLPSAETREEAVCLDGELFRLARGRGRRLLRVGLALVAIGEGTKELGFSTFGSWANERLSRGGRWASDVRAFAQRLLELPLIRDAFERCNLSRAKAELLARRATPDNERALLELAHGKSVRALREAFRQIDDDARAQQAEALVSAEDDAGPRGRWQEEAQDDPTVELCFSATRREAMMLESTKLMIQLTSGATGGGWVEWLLAESHREILALAGEDGDKAEAQLLAAQAQQLAELDAKAEAQAQREARAEPWLSLDEVDPERADDEPLPTTLLGLEAFVRSECKAMDSEDLFFGELASRFLSIRGWKALGYASERQYCEERLGLSKSSVRNKVRLFRKAKWTTGVAEAVRQSRLGTQAALQVVRVATPDTEQAWIERAEQRTFKHLREEIDMVETVTRFASDVVLPPPTADEIALMQDVERDVLCGATIRRALGDDEQSPAPEPRGEVGEPYLAYARQHAQLWADRAPTEVIEAAVVGDLEAARSVQTFGDEEPGQGAVQTSGTVSFRARVPEDVATQFHMLRTLYEELGLPLSFFEFLCVMVWRTWHHELGHSDCWEHIYRRDLYRCKCPVCNRRSLTLHHIQYKGHLGGDAPENLVGICEFCHLWGEHEGRLKVVAPGEEPTFILGRQPILMVRGRDKTELAPTNEPTRRVWRALIEAAP